MDQQNLESIEKKVQEERDKIRKEFEIKEEEMNNKISESILRERKTLVGKQKLEIENLRKQHEKEIDVIFSISFD